MKTLALETQLVHTGERHGPPRGMPVATPIYTTSTYSYESMDELTAALACEGGDYIYSRYGNPTVTAVEHVMASIEHGRVAVAYGSGMAAIHAAILACRPEPEGVVLASRDLYGASFAMLHTIFGPFGIRTEIVDLNDLDEFRRLAEGSRPFAVLAETISNPLLKVCDLTAVAAIAHGVGARLVVDNTFASPYLCCPLDHGADLVLHSATKYLGGHGDAMGGVVVSNSDEDGDMLDAVKRLAGGVMSAWEAHEISRGIKTLALRHQRQCENASAIAEVLADDPRIGKVHFPTLSGDLDIVKRMLREPNGGALVTIELADNTRDAAFAFMDRLRLCVRATSLGDVQTLVSHPPTSSHREFTITQREAVGITEGMVRVSVGIEDAADLIDDIKQALG